MEQFIINDNITVKQALKRIDETSKKILFVVDHDNKFLGTLSDGDLRRHILNSGKLTSSIQSIYNSNPVYYTKLYDISDIKQTMLTKHIEAIPIIDSNNIIIDILFWDQVFTNGEKKELQYQLNEVPLVIMAGGKGTRLDPFTKIIPKPLIPIGEKPIVEIIMDKFAASGIEDFYLSINYKGEMIKSYFENEVCNYNINYIVEEKFLGTAGSLLLLPPLETDTIIVSNCDIIVDADYCDMVKYHKDNHNDLTVLGSIQHYVIPYGVLEYTDNGIVESIKEKPEYDLPINTGIYVMNTDVINYIPKDKMFHITDLINLLISDNKKVGMYPVSEKSYVDIGQLDEYKQVIRKLLY